MCLVVPACCLKTLRYCGVVTRVMYEQTQQREKAGAGLAHTLDREGRADRVVEEGERKARDQKLVPQMGQRERLRSAVADTWLTLPCLFLSLSLSLPLSLLLCSFFTMRLTAHWADSGRAFFLFPFSFFPFPCQPPPPPPSPLLSHLNPPTHLPPPPSQRLTS